MSSSGGGANYDTALDHQMPRENADKQRRQNRVQQRSGGGRQDRRLFRDGKLKRRRGGIVLSDEDPSDRLREINSDPTASFSERWPAAAAMLNETPTDRERIDALGPRKKKFRLSPDGKGKKEEGSKAAKRQGKSAHKKKKKEKRVEVSPNQIQKRLRSFMPSPDRMTYGQPPSLPWSLPLPGSKTTIKSNHHFVVLDGYGDDANVSIDSSGLGEWLVGTSDEQLDGSTLSADEEEARTSQTVVWENDDECFPMSDWQTTVHVSCYRPVL